MSAPVPVTFLPSGATAVVAPGATVASAARLAGAELTTPCGTRGICGECGVRVAFGELEPPDQTEAETLKRAPAGVRLACRARIAGPVGVKPLVARGLTATSALTGELGHGAELVAGVDLGTTNVSAVVVDAKTGRRIATALVPNSQQAFGADVLSRLTAATEGESGALAEAAQSSAAEAIALACDAAGVTADALSRVIIVGNTAMTSLLLGLRVEALAVHPFELPFSSPETLAPSIEAARAIPALRGALVVPPLAGFVGGDALAAALATGLLSSPGDRLLVDVGTNAEIVLRTGDRLLVASAAAGPAFEGWGITNGGMAGVGAVERVSAAGGAMRLETSGGERPDRFSGAGLVSALAALRALAWVDPDGRIDLDRTPAEHVSTDSAGVLSVLVGRGERVLALSQLDIRALQLAKAAVRAAIDGVLAVAGVDPAALREVLVAGAFGYALVPREAGAIGLVPEPLVPAMRAVGNAALLGAATLAFSPESLTEALDFAKKVEHVDLASEEGFRRNLIASLRLAP